MAEETNVQGTGITAPEQEKTFTQADVDKMIQSRLDRERKNTPARKRSPHTGHGKTASRPNRNGRRSRQKTLQTVRRH